MDITTFTTEALRTEPTYDEPIELNETFLKGVLQAHQATGNMLDQLKKRAFYRKDYNMDELTIQFQQMLEGIDAMAPLLANELNGEEGITSNEETLQINNRIFHGVVGAATEAVELLEALKFDGSDMDYTNISEECGDFCWYLAIMSDEIGIKVPAILEMNINKLVARYPEKFTTDNAIHRDLETERAILEGGAEEGGDGC